MLCRKGLLGVLALALLPALLWSAAAPVPPEPDPPRAVEARLKRDVTFLASDRCEGRGPTTEGINLAADYVADQFRQAGLRPGNGNSYFQPFHIAGAEGHLALTGPLGQRIDLRQRIHFNPLGYDQAGNVSGPLAFAGYGLATKDYDDYAGLDAKGKVLVILRDTPRAGTAGRPKDWLAGAPFVNKLALAQKKGALAVLFVNDADTASDSDAPPDFSYSSVTRGGRHLPAVFIRRDLFERMLPAGRSLRDLERDIDSGLKPDSFDLPGWKVELDVKRNGSGIALKNVVGVLEGAGPLAQETIVVGAHYDHLGYGSVSSLSRSKRREIHHGADDNASGTTALIELARRFASLKDRQGRRLVFIAFSGEELGLFGSRHYCNKPLFPLDKTAAMFNLDMVGRLRDDPKTGKARLLTEGHGTAKPFKELIDKLAGKYAFTLSAKPAGFGPSDHASFCGKKVPVLFFWTGNHADYHRPTDTADKINVSGMRRVVDLSQGAIAFLSRMDKPAFIEVKGAAGPRPSGGPRLGIRPGYGSDAAGVEVDGVTPGGPADKAGVKDGDVIVGLAGKPVKDLRTYMLVMSTQKKGDTIEVEVQRKGKKVKLKAKLE
jgi:hypothetical protein